MSEDYYETLGVSRESSDDEIKKSYRKLAHEHHPDRGGDEAKFKEVNQAYQVLSDKQKRSQYDQFGATFDGSGPTGASDPGGAGSYGPFSQQQQGFNVDFDDIDLGDIFGSFFGGQRKQSSSGGSAAGDDISVVVDLSFKEAAFGLEKELELYKRVKCDKCKGNGAEPGTKVDTCATCSGTGQVRRSQQTMLGAFTQVVACHECKGQGKKIEKPCTQCGGDGRFRENQKIKVKIPAGIADGQTIEISEKGEAGTHSGACGNLYVTVHVAEHEFFKRDGYDLRCEIPVSFTQAALGNEINIKTLDSEEKLKIPAGTQTGKVFRIHNKGLKYLNGSGTGDLLVKANIITPTKLTQREKELFKNIAAEKGEGAEVNQDKKGFFSKLFD